MAKRRKLEAPTQDELEAIAAAQGEAERAARPQMAGMAPIARIASEAARLGGAPGGAGGQEAALWREAEAEGRVVLSLPLARIDAGWIPRDRAVVAEVELEELVTSIRESGQRLPVEVVPLPDGRYGLVSGLRRVMALQRIAAEGGEGRVLALVRETGAAATGFVRMVEENEVRADLSPYERGRIAVVAAGQGAFPTVAAAVDAMFFAASKAKRSKVRSFAAVHEGLGDLLGHGPALGERQGLRLAAALREGRGGALRAALERLQETEEAPSREAEWAALERVLDGAPAAPERAAERRTETGDALGRGLVVERRRDRLILHLRGLAEADRDDLVALIERWAADR